MLDTSIAIAANDNYSQAITTMMNSTKAFSKDVDGMQGKLDALNATKTTLKVDTKAAKDNLLVAEKAFVSARDKVELLQKKLDNFSGKRTSKAFLQLQEQVAKANAAFEQSGEAMAEANAGYEQARRNLALVSKEAGTTEKAMVGIIDKSRKAGNQVGGGSSSIIGAVAATGIGSMVGALAQDAANTLVSSIGGASAGSIFSSTLSSAISGAAIGSIVPVIGTAAGAVIGAGVGALSGGIQTFQKRDDAFKSYVQDNTENQLSQRQSDIETGSGIAAGREQDAIAFNRILGAGKGDAYLEKVREKAAETPMTYGDLTTMSRSLSTGFGGDTERMLKLMGNIGDAGSAVGIDAFGMDEMAKSMSRMQSSGKATLEYLNIFQERGVNVIDLLAKGMGKSQGEIYAMISKSQLSGVEAVSIIETGMDNLYGGAMEAQSKTFSGRSSTLADAETEMQAAYGIGYNETRGKGNEAQTDYLTGDSGEQIQEANKAIGAWQASLENSKEKFIRDAQDAVLNSDAYKEAMTQGGDVGYAEAGEMLMAAKVQGMNEYNASEGAQLALASEKSLAETIRNDADSNQNYWDAGYEKAEWYTKGLGAGMADKAQGILASGGTLIGGNYYNKGGGMVPGLGLSGVVERMNTADWPQTHFGPAGTPYMQYQGGFQPGAPRNAFGLNYVPRDDFPSILHQGERVLTASQARTADRAGGSMSVTFTGPIAVREEADLDKLARRFAERLQRASLLAVPT